LAWTSDSQSVGRRQNEANIKCRANTLCLKTILVSGASRGIGLELVKQLAAQPETRVIAGMRKPFSIESPKNDIQVLQLDQTSADSVAAVAAQVPELDTLILNAAIGEDDHLLDLPAERFTEYLNTNVVGPNRVVQSLLPALLARKTRQIIYISSSAGSIQGQISTNWGLQGPYAVTKAAGNMMVVQWQNELTDKAFTVVTVHPGWVDTDMGRLGGSGAMGVEQSASKLVELANGLKREHGSKFFNYDGAAIAW
jgi:NAD(P)-dependent dehydrogenase (short-subunit alcohol dehydrogenase family)